MPKAVTAEETKVVTAADPGGWELLQDMFVVLPLGGIEPERAARILVKTCTTNAPV